jgi:hypothetical protein
MQSRAARNRHIPGIDRYVMSGYPDSLEYLGGYL